MSLQSDYLKAVADLAMERKKNEILEDHNQYLRTLYEKSAERDSRLLEALSKMIDAIQELGGETHGIKEALKPNPN